jgi:hypothetical protein
MNLQEKTIDNLVGEEQRTANTGLAKVAVHFYADSFVVKENLYSA